MFGVRWVAVRKLWGIRLFEVRMSGMAVRCGCRVSSGLGIENFSYAAALDLYVVGHVLGLVRSAVVDWEGVGYDAVNRQKYRFVREMR